MASVAQQATSDAAVIPFRRPEREALRYHAGKFQLAHWIIEHLAPHRQYVEPYGGAMSVLLQKEPAEIEIYNDCDSRVVDYFDVLRDHVAAARLRQLLQLTPFHPAELELSGEWHHDPVERARRLVVRTFMSRTTEALLIDGVPGFRSCVGRSGASTAREWAALPDHLEAITQRLRLVAFKRSDALDVIAKCDTPDTLIFVDPPSLPDARATARQRSRRAFRADMPVADHRALLQALRGSEGMVVLAAQESELYDRMLAGWTKYRPPASLDPNRAKMDTLWLNPLAESRRPSPSLFGALK
ncbi:DNA adenine methylase [Sphingosinicella sp. BN140058]|uniref:DNA adenine methylase n=1 Tax=Sphingosinicella sp. BN140058 TaxID=1892855 RepID=UPI001012ABE6|nr:DNA adenine methylase [Sphingosinicella sp. BN140058]QAY80162.1 DNA adenine methylase [Sphingosinicella sp. BN140058]